jgi:hypothetical protein
MQNFLLPPPALAPTHDPANVLTETPFHVWAERQQRHLARFNIERKGSVVDAPAPRSASLSLDPYAVFAALIIAALGTRLFSKKTCIQCL